MAIASTTIIGPDGDSVYRGGEIPNHWPEDFRQDLLEAGVAVEIESEAELAEKLAEWNRVEPEEEKKGRKKKSE